MDVLSEVLSVVRLTGALYFDIRARAPWVAETPAATDFAPYVMPSFEHVIAFHVVIEGSCLAQLADESEPSVRLESGDAVLFVGGDAHFLATEPGIRAKPDLNMFRSALDRPRPFVIKEFGGNGEPARIACGYLGCDNRPFNPILGALPRRLHVRRSTEQGHLIYQLIHVALQESDGRRAGSESILSRLSELLFLQAVRDHIDSLAPEAKGWLAGLRDRQVGAALYLMHNSPASAWSLDSLAREIGMSRSTFAERFNHLVGTPPMQYLSNWRLQLAARMLERGTLSIAQAAMAVGYESEAAFNRAFKRRVGAPPGAWRKRHSADDNFMQVQDN